MSKISFKSLDYFKPNITQLINSHLLDYNLRNFTKKIVSNIITNNKKAKKYFSKYINISSYISYSLINNIFLHYYSSSITDYLFNLINISSYNNNLPLSSIEKISFTKTIFLINKFIEPVVIEKLSKRYFGKMIIKGIKMSNIAFKLLYMIKDNFMYTNLINYCLGIITINKGETDENILLSLFLVYLFFNIGYKTYNKIKQKEIKIEKERKTFNVIINEKIKKEILPIPDKEYYLLRNKNFSKLIKNKKGLCLICNKEFVTPTAIKCCGGVFCYKCIYNYLILYEKCFLCFQILKLNKEEINKLLIKIYS